MTNGQLQKLQELVECRCMPRKDKAFVLIQLDPWWGPLSDPMSKDDKATLRRLWHQYRHQIAAMKRNRQA